MPGWHIILITLAADLVAAATAVLLGRARAARTDPATVRRPWAQVDRIVTNRMPQRRSWRRRRRSVRRAETRPCPSG
jgi:hypothetical protein